MSDSHDRHPSSSSTERREAQPESVASSSTTPLQMQQQQQQQPPPARGAAIRRVGRGGGEFGRYRFEYDGRKVYDFEQSLDDVTIYVDAPPGTDRGDQVACEISATRLRLRLRMQEADGTWYLNEDTYDTVDVAESTWSLEDSDDDGKDKNNTKSRRGKVITIYLVKARRGTLWEAALKGNPAVVATANGGDDEAAGVRMDPLAQEEVRKELLRQRFQEENAGFDFRGAEFNGSVPDARDFMGGIQYR
jgi:hypothetical protein